MSSIIMQAQPLVSNTLHSMWAWTLKLPLADLLPVAAFNKVAFEELLTLIAAESELAALMGLNLADCQSNGTVATCTSSSVSDRATPHPIDVFGETNSIASVDYDTVSLPEQSTDAQSVLDADIMAMLNAENAVTIEGWPAPTAAADADPLAELLLPLLDQPTHGQQHVMSDIPPAPASVAPGVSSVSDIRGLGPNGEVAAWQRPRRGGGGSKKKIARIGDAQQTGKPRLPNARNASSNAMETVKRVFSPSKGHVTKDACAPVVAFQVEQVLHQGLNARRSAKRTAEALGHEYSDEPVTKRPRTDYSPVSYAELLFYEPTVPPTYPVMSAPAQSLESLDGLSYLDAYLASLICPHVFGPSSTCVLNPMCS
jgi:hypothetical protein